MKIQILKSKIHRVKVTGADLNYIGSITIDRDLMDAANIIAGEKVQIVNINNGERLETYVIPGKRNSGEITLNGPAARRVAKGDIIIIIAYAIMDFEDAKNFEPSVIFPNEKNNIVVDHPILKINSDRSKVGAGYMKIINNSTSDNKVVMDSN